MRGKVDRLIRKVKYLESELDKWKGRTEFAERELAKLTEELEDTKEALEDRAAAMAELERRLHTQTLRHLIA